MYHGDVQTLKADLKRLIPSGMGETLLALKKVLPAGHPIFNQIIQLESRLEEVNRQRRMGILSDEALQLEYNRIRASLIEVIDGLSEESFSVLGENKSDRRKKKGSILYQIPNQMELDKETRCRIRLAFKEEYLFENLSVDGNTKIESIRISEVMEASIVDPGAEPAFDIRSLNSAEQFIDVDDFTEWLFIITPRKEGNYPILLKVSVIEEHKGKERRKEIVLEEEVQIVTLAAQTDEVFKEFQSETLFVPAVDAIKPTPQANSNLIRRYAPLGLILLFAVVGTWAADFPQRIFWQKTTKIDSISGYEAYIDRYEEEGLFYEIALWKITSIQDAISRYKNYLEEFPEGKFKEEALAKIDSLSQLNGIQGSPETFPIPTEREIYAVPENEVDQREIVGSPSKVEPNLENGTTEDAITDKDRELTTAETNGADEASPLDPEESTPGPASEKENQEENDLNKKAGEEVEPEQPNPVSDDSEAIAEEVKYLYNKFNITGSRYNAIFEEMNQRLGYLKGNDRKMVGELVRKLDVFLDQYLVIHNKTIAKLKPFTVKNEEYKTIYQQAISLLGNLDEQSYYVKNQSNKAISVINYEGGEKARPLCHELGMRMDFQIKELKQQERRLDK